MMYDSHKYGKYINNNQETRWATVEEIQNAGEYINLSDEDYHTAGLPLLSNGKEAYVDDKDTHTLIFGATGSKKTRLFCMPMLNLFAKAGESFIVTDPKGELYAKTSGLVKNKGYKTVVLDFRNIGHGDMWNPLALPYELYHSEDREIGVAMLNDFITTIAEPMRKGARDPFWPDMAATLALANLLMLMEYGKKEEINVASLASMCSMSCAKDLAEMSENMSEETLAGSNYKGVFVGAENTQKSVYISLYGMLRVFNVQENLTRMLSGNTIDMRSIGREKTAVYVIVPDEKTTYHFLVTTFIKQVYEVLISEAQKEKDFRLPVRVNFVLDEFCNIPKIPDMPAMISAARSRNMRYYLVAQSMHQLRSKYGEEADTIKGNCDNWVFLTSKELALLNEISDLCGSIRTADGRLRKLISVSELQRLDKNKGEALIMHARQYPLITEMADIDMYEDFKGYESVELEKFALPRAQIFSVKALYNKYKSGEIPCPFAPVQAAKPQKEYIVDPFNDVDSDIKLQKEIEKHFNSMFSNNKKG